MRKLYSLLVVSLFFSLLLRANDDFQEKHVEVALRMIGHQVLLHYGDSTSRVLPIVEEQGKFKIQFESDLAIEPEELVAVVKEVTEETDLAEQYIVEVVTCELEEVVYSFESLGPVNQDIIPCGGRNLPESCYAILITLPNVGAADATLLHNDEGQDADSGWLLPFLLLVGGGIVISVLISKKKSNNRNNPNLISFGKYRYDKIKEELLFENEKIDLSSKEADLLLLLYKDVNTTVEREVLLNLVWGDQGDYVGRTLDVFISKLRKKLSLDDNLKIVNVRGVGYKLVMDTVS